MTLKGFGGHWRFLTWICYLDFDFDMGTGVWYTHVPNFGSLSWFLRCKEHPCPLGHHLKIWRTLEVPDWGVASWSWFGCGHWSLIEQWSKFLLSILILKMQWTSMTFKSSFWGAGGCRRFLNKVWHLDLFLDMAPGLWYALVQIWPSFLILKEQKKSMSFNS